MDRALPDFRGTRALVLGDCMLDRYITGHVARISPEAPVPVVSIANQSSSLGGAGNVAAGIAALGGLVSLAGVIGSDVDGQDFLHLCGEYAIDTSRVLRSTTLSTTCKTRVVADRFHQLLRLDRDGDVETRSILAAQLDDHIRDLKQFDVVVLADYDKGSLCDSVIRTVMAGCEEQGIPCLVDSKRASFDIFCGATIITPNVRELERAFNHRFSSEAELVDACRTLREQLALDHVLCTRSSEGMILCTSDTITTVPAVARDVADVTGAGDTVVASLALCLARNWTIQDACRLATLAAGIAVSEPCVYVVPFDRLQDAWSGKSAKIVDVTLASERLESARRDGKRIVFTNGCFDILHAGHLACLEQARKLGDVLVLGLNSDTSVRAIKGEGRPRIHESHRAALLAGLECVDFVVVFAEPTPELLIRALRPDVLVKGGDYDPDTMVGSEMVRSYGGQVVVIPLVDGLSTTAILRNANL